MGSHNRFLLVILEETLKDDKIRLPEKTVQKFGVKIPNRVVFKLPDNVEWEMEVIKSEKRVWFHRGWREFIDYYGLERGSLLTLKFDGESTFKVFIFDKTANEIEYPCNRKTSKSTKLKTKDSIKLERDCLDLTRGNPSLPDRRPYKKLKREDPLTRIAELRDTHIVSSEEEDGDKLRAEAIPILKRRKTVSATRKIQALARTSSFKSANPFFRVVMQPSYISSSFNLYVPRKFSQKYFLMKQGDGTFTVSNGRTWRTSYMIEDLQCRVRFLSGWREFVLDNHLKVGDVCIFELIETRRLSFKVSIFPVDNCQDVSSSRHGVAKRRGRPRSQVTEKSGSEMKTEAVTTGVAPREDNSDFQGPAEERALKFTPRNPFFVSPLFTSHVNGGSCLFLPTEFKQTHLKGVAIEHLQDIVLRTSDGRKWLAKFHLNQRNQDLQVRIGWSKFVQDNNLKEGDFCVFELVMDFRVLFNVHIFRASENEVSRQIPAPTGGDRKIGVNHPSSFSGDPKPLRNPRKHSTQSPLFEISISSTSIIQASLHIPAKFAKKYFAGNNIEKVTLKVGDRRWAVKVKRYGSTIKISGGWRTFARDNALQVRDVCIFELVDENYEFEVSVLRSNPFIF